MDGMSPTSPESDDRVGFGGKGRGGGSAMALARICPVQNSVLIESHLKREKPKVKLVQITVSIVRTPWIYILGRAC